MVARWIALNEDFDNPEQDFSYVSNFVLMWSYVERKLVEEYGTPNDSLGGTKFDQYMRRVGLVTNGYVDGAYAFFSNRYAPENEDRYFNDLFLGGRDERFEGETRELVRLPDADYGQRIRAVAFICTRIRNNLFHGAKELPMIAEQEDLLQNATIGLKGLAISFGVARDV